MSIQLELPPIGEGVEEAGVAEILVSEGDVIEKDQTVMELETDKAVVELPCPHAGKIEKILVSSGDTIRIGDPLLVIAGDAEPEADGSGSDAQSASKQETAEASNGSDATSAATATATASGEEKQDAPEPEQEDVGSGETEMVTGEVEFRLPALGEGVDSADVAEITVSEGDVIEADETVMELETEKAVVELPCPHAGKIKQIHVSEGDTISADDLILTIESSSAVSTPEKKQDTPPQQATDESKQPPKPEQKQETPPQSPPREAPARSASPEGNGEQTETPVPAAPSTRRLARQLGVDLRQVRGSAAGGRITQEDVQAFVRERMSLPARGGAGGELAVPAAGAIAPPPLPDFSRFGPVEREKMNKIARTAAENLTVSWNVIPHVTHHERVDVTDLEAARKRFTQGIGKNGPKVTMTAIVMKALATCLQSFPKFNSSLDPETQELVYKRYYHVGCAVDTPNGLLVPVIRDCDQKNILDIAAELADLAEKARDRKLPVEAMQGATCTVTNLGGIGGAAFTPIVNYPEVCILGMSRGQQELKLIDGEVRERLILPLSLSYDHRVINGADAARFMVMLANLLGDPFQMLTTV
jgi:pyruvate dehydrogenase E2 component (dihydrolipoamide acetyltransferase)